MSTPSYRFIGAGQGYGGGGRANLRPTTSPPSPLPPRCLPPTPHPSNDERHVHKTIHALTRSARSCPSKQQPLPLPPHIIIGRSRAVPVAAASLSLPVSWPDSPVSGARNSRLDSLIDLTADRATPGESSILALTPPQADWQG